MAIELGVSSGKKATGKEIFPKVYLDEVVIKAVQDKSGQSIFEGQDPSDLAIELELEVKGLDSTIKQTLNGNFKRNDDGSVADWGGAFVIDYMLQKLNFYENKSDEEKASLIEAFTSGSIPREVREFLVGKRIWRISYVKGIKPTDSTKYAYATWNKLHGTEEDAIENFTWAIKNDKYIQQKYTPDVELDNGSSDDSGSEQDEIPF